MEPYRSEARENEQDHSLLSEVNLQETTGNGCTAQDHVTPQ